MTKGQPWPSSSGVTLHRIYLIAIGEIKWSCDVIIAIKLQSCYIIINMRSLLTQQQVMQPPM